LEKALLKKQQETVNAIEKVNWELFLTAEERWPPKDITRQQA